jgi:hypothetical protein
MARPAFLRASSLGWRSVRVGDRDVLRRLQARGATSDLDAGLIPIRPRRVMAAQLRAETMAHRDRQVAWTSGRRPSRVSRDARPRPRARGNSGTPGWTSYLD